MFGARIKIMWEEQLVDPPIHYITSVNIPFYIFSNIFKALFWVYIKILINVDPRISRGAFSIRLPDIPNLFF